MSEQMITFLTNLGIGIIIAVIGYFAALYISRAVKFILAKFLSPTWASFVSSATFVGVILLTIQLIINLTGFSGFLVAAVTALTGAFAIGSFEFTSDVNAGIQLLFIKY